MNLKMAGALGLLTACGVLVALSLKASTPQPEGWSGVGYASDSIAVPQVAPESTALTVGTTTGRGSSVGAPVSQGGSPERADPKHPHEPAGFVAFAENDFSRMPRSNQLAPEGLAGVWRAKGVAPGGEGSASGDGDDESPQEGAGGRLQLAQDPTAPASPPGVLRMKFPRGWKAGNGPVNWGGWDKGGPAAQKAKIYLSLWLRIVGPNYENQSVGTKMGFIASGPAPEVKGHSGNQSLFFLKGYGKQGVFPAFNVEFHQFFNAQIHPPFRTLHHPQNADRRALMTAGSWHHWEMVMVLNDVGRDNGSLNWWIDGTEVMRYNSLTYRIPGAERGFWNFKFNPTWGGTGGVKTRDDFIDVDHVYFSGVPLSAE